jgi:hypothetical protein
MIGSNLHSQYVFITKYLVKNRHNNALPLLTMPNLQMVKVKVVTVLSFLSERHAMKTYWGVEVQLHAFFDFGTRWR